MSGKEVFKLAVNNMAQAATKVLHEAHCDLSDIKCFITHQANYRIIEAVADKLKVPKEKCFSNVHRYGNISAACIPVAMHEAESQFSFKRGDKILLAAFGGGLTWGATLLEW
jgi:3-oxoacyl-[acyl-carrier-protein] synthase-3